MPFNLDPSIFYNHIEIFQITCYDTSNTDCLRYGISICDLNPLKWNLNKIRKIIEDIKNE